MKANSFQSTHFEYRGKYYGVTMPAKDEHTAQADHNRGFWGSFDLSSTTFLDWVVTGIFYEGAHWVEAFLETRGEHSDDHRERLRAMRRNTELAPITVDLETLKQESENARYRCYKHTPNQVKNDLIPIVDNIKNHIQGIL